MPISNSMRDALIFALATGGGGAVGAAAARPEDRFSGALTGAGVGAMGHVGGFLTPLTRLKGVQEAIQSGTLSPASAKLIRGSEIAGGSALGAITGNRLAYLVDYLRGKDVSNRGSTIYVNPSFNITRQEPPQTNPYMETAAQENPGLRKKAASMLGEYFGANPTTGKEGEIRYPGTGESINKVDVPRQWGASYINQNMPKWTKDSYSGIGTEGGMKEAFGKSVWQSIGGLKENGSLNFNRPQATWNKSKAIEQGAQYLQQNPDQQEKPWMRLSDSTYNQSLSGLSDLRMNTAKAIGGKAMNWMKDNPWPVALGVGGLALGAGLMFGGNKGGQQTTPINVTVNTGDPNNPWQQSVFNAPTFDANQWKGGVFTG